jgi:hypothetical protein
MVVGNSASNRHKTCNQGPLSGDAKVLTKASY